MSDDCHHFTCKCLAAFAKEMHSEFLHGKLSDFAPKKAAGIDTTQPCNLQSITRNGITRAYPVIQIRAIFDMPEGNKESKVFDFPASFCPLCGTRYDYKKDFTPPTSAEPAHSA